MKISTRGRYGLRAMAYIAAKSREGTPVVNAKSISESQGISVNYLEQIVLVLKVEGFLNSVRGAGGGYMLAKAPGEITAGEVLRALEGSLSPAECLDTRSGSGAEKAGCGTCGNCTARDVLSRVYESVTEVVDSITIEDIINGISGNSIN